MSQATEIPPGLEPPAGAEDEPVYEVIDGRRVELPPMGIREGIIANQLSFPIARHAEADGIGRTVTEILFKLFPDRNQKRRPDVAFVSFERWPRDRPVPPGSFWEVVPDLAVEVVSPSDPVVDLIDKIRDYFDAGTRRVWVIVPDARLTYVYRSPREVAILRAEEPLDHGEALPGLRITLDEVLRAAGIGERPGRSTDGGDE